MNDMKAIAIQQAVSLLNSLDYINDDEFSEYLLSALTDHDGFSLGVLYGNLVKDHKDEL